MTATDSWARLAGPILVGRRGDRGFPGVYRNRRQDSRLAGAAGGRSEPRSVRWGWPG